MAGSTVLRDIQQSIRIGTALLYALWLPLSLIVGLLTFPTSCACGDDMSHEHALFSLANHTHLSAPDSSLASDDTHSNNRVAVEADTTDASMQAPGYSMNSNAQVAVLAAAVLTLTATGVTLTPPFFESCTGVSSSPDIPPPQA